MIAVGAWLTSPRHVRNFALTVGALLFYIFAADKLGFLICGSLILLTLFSTLRVRLRLALPLALVVTIGIHLVFYKLLRVPLPWGMLPPLW